MKTKQFILAGAIATALGGAAHAQTVYITGSTAYRSSAIIAIEALYGAGKYACVYSSKDGTVTTEQKASSVAFLGLSNANNGLAGIEIKCCWAGSVGGLNIVDNNTLNITDQPGAKGWIPDSLIPTSGTTFYPDTSITYDTTSKADAAFTDAFQETLGITDLVPCGTAGDPGGRVGVIVFEWVAGNAVGGVRQINGATWANASTTVNYTSSSATLVANYQIGGKGIAPGTKITGVNTSTKTITLSAPTTAANTTPVTISSSTLTSSPITNIDNLKARAIIGGGAYYSQFTGLNVVSPAANYFVYSYGRNADSGTRVSVLAESGFGLTGHPQHAQPVITGGGSSGTGGQANRKIASLALWPAETVLGTPYPAGESGYGGGGDLAGALTAWGAYVAPPTVGGAPLLYSSLSNKQYMVGYLGRNDAETACSQVTGSNTAHRIMWNGSYDWNPVNGNLPTRYTDQTYDGKPKLGYNDNAVTTGKYTLWETEHFYRNATADADNTKQTVTNALADAILAGDPGTNNIPLSAMKVSRAKEGAVIIHN